jgi:hypothetical protein
MSKFQVGESVVFCVKLIGLETFFGNTYMILDVVNNDISGTGNSQQYQLMLDAKRRLIAFEVELCRPSEWFGVGL